MRDKPEDIITRNRQILQAYYLQGQNERAAESVEIHKRMWSSFAEATLQKQKLKAFELNQNTSQQVFIWFNIEFQGVKQNKNTNRSF